MKNFWHERQYLRTNQAIIEFDFVFEMDNSVYMHAVIVVKAYR